MKRRKSLSPRLRKMVRESAARAEKGKAIYERELKKILEPKFNGKIVCIDYDTKEFFIGRDVDSAMQKAAKKYPNKIFFLTKVGAPALFTLNRLLH
jgi:hypothetical protein